jgi:hypothetical protein
MENISFDQTKEGLHLVLGITEERVAELIKLFQKDEWELSCPDREDGFSGAELLERFVSHAASPAEQVFCSYMAGSHIEGLIAEDEEEYDFEDE